MTKKLPPADDWQNRSIEDWNATTFRAYLSEKHKEKLDIRYVTNSIPKEASAIKRMVNEHGPKVVKVFIDECLENYSPSNTYPSVSFMFMYSYMRERILPRAITKAQEDEVKDASEEVTETLDDDDFEEWV